MHVYTYAAYAYAHTHTYGIHIVHYISSLKTHARTHKYFSLSLFLACARNTGFGMSPSGPSHSQCVSAADGKCHHEHGQAQRIASASIGQRLPEAGGKGLLGRWAEPCQVEVNDGAGESQVEGRAKTGCHT